MVCPFLSDAFVQASFQILFRHFSASEIRLQYDCVLSLLPLGSSSGMVIDVGYECTSIYTVGYGVVDLIHSVCR